MDLVDKLETVLRANNKYDEDLLEELEQTVTEWYEDIILSSNLKQDAKELLSESLEKLKTYKEISSNQTERNFLGTLIYKIEEFIIKLKNNY